ncbi:MAG TPA: DUF2235 domain-containing protein [Thermoanaerobaculia bacterium]|nr:DUF2235 domain-containing protein [Thermoanaerobaculia bacterium]
MKNIVICLDGTGNEFGDANSNVVKLYATLDHNTTEQIAYYHPGLGTMGAPNALSKVAKWCTRQFGLAFGYGIVGAIEDAYAFLMDTYQPGDRVYLFGFSRGAYTARALAGMLHMIGLIRAGNKDLIKYATRFLTQPTEKTWSIAAQFKATFSRECKAHFVGVWDTVSSVGWIYDSVKLPYTANNPDMAIGRHAIAIDERRCFFRQNLWTSRKDTQDIKQVWFAGVHSDIGGSYPEAESGLAKITLEWMLREAANADLRIDPAKRDRVLGRTDTHFAPPNPTAPMHQSLRGWWLLLEILPRRRYDNTVEPPEWRWQLPLGRRRRIDPPITLHHTVITRMARFGYAPTNLPSERTIET